MSDGHCLTEGKTMTAATRFPGPKHRPVKQVRDHKWRAEHREATAAHNRRVAESGPFIVLPFYGAMILPSIFSIFIFKNSFAYG